MDYQNRFCLFLDVLGFSELIEQSQSEGGENALNQANTAISYLLSLLPTLQRELQRNPPHISQSVAQLDFKVTQFSDCLVVSFLDSPDNGTINRHTAKHTIFIRLHRILRDAVTSGIIFRGGLTYGLLCHRDDRLFGPAFIEAYRLEHSAIYPRVLTTREVVERLNLVYPEPESDYLYRMFRAQRSNLVSWDYLSLENVGLSDRALYGQNLVTWMRALSTVIDRGLEHRKVDVKAKYDWLAARFHTTANILVREDVFPKNAPLSQGLLDLWGDLLDKYAPRSGTLFRDSFLARRVDPSPGRAEERAPQDSAKGIGT